jgi:hypothetical protein
MELPVSDKGDVLRGGIHYSQSQLGLVNFFAKQNYKDGLYNIVYLPIQLTRRS